jgi:hypothetical protein
MTWQFRATYCAAYQRAKLQQASVDIGIALLNTVYLIVKNI